MAWHPSVKFYSSPYFINTAPGYIVLQEYLLIASEVIPDAYIRDKTKGKFRYIQVQELNYTIIVRKVVKQSIGWPFGHCLHYRTDGQRLGATSQTECYRNCLKELYNTQYKCVPLFVDKLLHESDINYLKSTENKLCETSPQMLKLIRNINPNVCRNNCPDDCRKVYYSSTTQDPIEYYAYELDKYVNIFDLAPLYRRVIWDTQPMLTYIEEPVMTFTQFVVNCGGLMGLWFGKSAKDLIVWFIELKASNRINHIINSIKSILW